MPSVANKGLELDLALAGSKIGIVEPTGAAGGGLAGTSLHGSGLHRQHRGPTVTAGITNVGIGNTGKSSSQTTASVVYNYKKYEGIADASRRLRDLEGNIASTLDANTTPLPKLRYHRGPGGRQVALFNQSPPAQGTSYGQVGPDPTTNAYTNRQRVLLEHDSNLRLDNNYNRTLLESNSLHKNNNSISSSNLTLKSGLHNIEVLPDNKLSLILNSDNQKLLLLSKSKSRPHSSEVLQERLSNAGLNGSPCLHRSPVGVNNSHRVGAPVHRHLSESLISNLSTSEQLALLNGKGNLRAHRSRSLQDHHSQEALLEEHQDQDDEDVLDHPIGQAPGTLHWRLSPRGASTKTTSPGADGEQVYEELPGRPDAPSPQADKDIINHALINPSSSINGNTQSLLDDEEDDENEHDEELVFTTSSFPRTSQGHHEISDAEVINRDVIDAVAAENAEIARHVQRSLRRLLKRAVTSAGSVSRGEVAAIQARLTSRASSSGAPVIHSGAPQDSEIALQERRDSVDSQDSGISSDSIRDTNCNIPPADVQAVVATATGNPAMEAILRHRRKKLSASKVRQKHKSRSSGKKSKLKTRPDSNKKGYKGGNDQQVPGNTGSLSLQAYCQTMQVLPSSLRPKAEKPVLFIPTPPVRSSTTAIYKERLPRVPQPTLTVDYGANSKTLDLSGVTIAAAPKRTLNLTRVSSPRRSYPEGAGRVFSGGAVEESMVRPTKVYLSERQSGVLNELGIDLPCAPPATPMPDLLKKVEYVPSMFDIRAQRAVKSKLEVLDRLEKKKKEKQQEQQIKKDKVALKEQVRDNKRQQRLQIYALNKVMTAFENENYLNFCAANGIEPDL